jgi:hypothetical protein
MHIPLIFDTIVRGLSPVTLIQLSRTCKALQAWVANFNRRVFNINRHLLRFFHDPLSFRSLQACTGTLISGSNALQFMDRSFYRRSDLNLYTHPRHAKEVGMWLIRHEGYVFLPNTSQGTLDFHQMDCVGWAPWRTLMPDGFTTYEEDLIDDSTYNMTGLDDVYRFEKSTTGQTLKIQIMSAEHSPMQCILGFHSSERPSCR